MSQRWRSLRVQLAVFAFAAIYVPVLLLFVVGVVTEDVASSDASGIEVVETTTSGPSGWVIATVVALAPVAAASAWWLAGLAVRPIDRVRAVAEEIEASNLQRRIDLRRGPTEVVALAASFDAMLERLEQAAGTQRELIEAASHELRTPLTVLTTNADVLLADPTPTIDGYRTGIERSRATADRMRTTIEELLIDARGRARTIDRVRADIATIARAVADEFAAAAAVGEITIVVGGETSVPCRVDEPTVHRAVANLVDNAVRFAPAASTVGLTVGVDGEMAFVRVADDGSGVAEGDQERIFDRFWRDPEHGGTGLGLPIARHIAAAHGGTLTVVSPTSSGTGTEFTLTLRC